MTRDAKRLAPNGKLAPLESPTVLAPRKLEGGTHSKLGSGPHTLEGGTHSKLGSGEHSFTAV